MTIQFSLSYFHRTLDKKYINMIKYDKKIIKFLERMAKRNENFRYIQQRKKKPVF